MHNAMPHALYKLKILPDAIPVFGAGEKTAEDIVPQGSAGKLFSQQIGQGFERGGFADEAQQISEGE
jgi:hypothetical protein